jgi:site-specific recombinase XerC
MLEDMRVRNLSPQTQSAYVLQVSLFARHFGRSPEVLGPEEIHAWQVHLTDNRRLSPASIAVAVSALRFLYKVTLRRAWIFEEVLPAPKQPQQLPVVLSPLEVAQFLGYVDDIKHHAISSVTKTACCTVSWLSAIAAIARLTSWTERSMRARSSGGPCRASSVSSNSLSRRTRSVSAASSFMAP